MGGGGTIVDGFRRLFHRRNGSTSNSHQSSVAGEGEEGSPDLEVIEDPDLVGLRAIRVPKRKMPLPVESHRKVSNPAPRSGLASVALLAFVVAFSCSLIRGHGKFLAKIGFLCPPLASILTQFLAKYRVSFRICIRKLCWQSLCLAVFDLNHAYRLIDAIRGGFSPISHLDEMFNSSTSSVFWFLCSYSSSYVLRHQTSISYRQLLASFAL